MIPRVQRSWLLNWVMLSVYVRQCSYAQWSLCWQFAAWHERFRVETAVGSRCMLYDHRLSPMILNSCIHWGLTFCIGLWLHVFSSQDLLNNRFMLYAEFESEASTIYVCICICSKGRAQLCIKRPAALQWQSRWHKPSEKAWILTIEFVNVAALSAVPRCTDNCHQTHAW